MNLKDLLYTLTIGVNRNDLESQYKAAINSALRKIQQRRSFSFMRQFDSIVFATGSQNGKLFDDFKELVKGNSPITWVSPTFQREIPCKVMHKNELKRLDAYMNYGYFLDPNAYSLTGNIPVYIDWIGGRPTLNLVRPVTTTAGQITFNVNYYRYLPDLENLTDDNEITRQFPELVENKAKAILFERFNDDMAGKSEALYEKYFLEARISDASRMEAGVRLLM